jgi:hypothetical protein
MKHILYAEDLKMNEGLNGNRTAISSTVTEIEHSRNLWTKWMRSKYRADSFTLAFQRRDCKESG